MFGKDIDKMGKWVYISPKDKTVSHLEFEEIFFNYSNEGIEAHYLIKGIVLPFVYEYEIEPNGSRRLK